MRSAIALVALLLSTAAHAGENGGRPQRFILPLPAGKDLLEQCSRETPRNVAGFWKPSMDDIDELESKLGPALAANSFVSHAASFLLAPDMLKNYHRQYIGIRIGADEYIYGNFYPVRGDVPTGSYESGPHGKEAEGPIMVCDGGPAFFGVVYRKKTHSIESLAFNGRA